MQRCQIHPLLWHDGRTPAAKPNYSVSEGSLPNWTFNPCQIFEINCLQHWTWLNQKASGFFTFQGCAYIYGFLICIFVTSRGKTLKAWRVEGALVFRRFSPILLPSRGASSHLPPLIFLRSPYSAAAHGYFTNYLSFAPWIAWRVMCFWRDLRSGCTWEMPYACVHSWYFRN